MLEVLAWWWPSGWQEVVLAGVSTVSVTERFPEESLNDDVNDGDENDDDNNGNNDEDVTMALFVKVSVLSSIVDALPQLI